MVELVDTQDLKSCALNRRAGSIPAPSTNKNRNEKPSEMMAFLLGTKLGINSLEFFLKKFNIGHQLLHS